MMIINASTCAISQHAFQDIFSVYFCAVDSRIKDVVTQISFVVIKHS